jgi:hypothetical protein
MSLADKVSEHLGEEQFTSGNQSLFIDVDVDASPEALAGNKALAEVRFKEELHKAFKKNLSEKDRANATEDQLVGSIHTIVPLDLEVVEHQNTLPYKMELQSDQFVGKSLHRNGRAMWTVAPGTQNTPVARKIFEPANIFDQRLYEKSQMCSLADIDDDIKLTSATKARAGFSTVATGTTAHEKLAKGFDKGEWRKFKLTQAEQIDICDPPSNARTVTVPLALGEALRSKLRAEWQEVIDRCISAEDLTFRLARSDGLPFNSPQGLHGALVGSDLDATGDGMVNIMLNRQERAHVKLLFTYRILGVK